MVVINLAGRRRPGSRGTPEAAARQDADGLLAALSAVRDPEIPELSIVDLGIVSEVDASDGGRIVLTPTYTGCPAYEVIERSVRQAVAQAGLPRAIVVRSFSPPWTTDRLTERARRVLREIGIAPPARHIAAGYAPVGFFTLAKPACPRCGSADTRLVSEFGATACKALHSCNACAEPFEHFKPI